MKLPRDLGGAELAKALSRVGYGITRQTGSHTRLTHPGSSQHHITIPAHTPLKPGTFSAIPAEIAGKQGFNRDELLDRLL
ncbi:MAG: hypothetical protein C0434_17305 [Xanthomonadaceae bacterium]|nr:hypothetical protein [Xanthomonadaceae bacterium]